MLHSNLHSASNSVILNRMEFSSPLGWPWWTGQTGRQKRTLKHQSETVRRWEIRHRRRNLETEGDQQTVAWWECEYITQSDLTQICTQGCKLEQKKWKGSPFLPFTYSPLRSRLGGLGDHLSCPAGPGKARQPNTFCFLTGLLWQFYDRKTTKDYGF